MLKEAYTGDHPSGIGEGAEKAPGSSLKIESWPRFRQQLDVAQRCESHGFP
jgi:hypothetical protein